MNRPMHTKVMDERFLVHLAALIEQIEQAHGDSTLVAFLRDIVLAGLEAA